MSDIAIARVSISRFNQELLPAAFMCVPGFSHSPSRTGSCELVIVATMSESAASSPLETAVTSMPDLFDILAAYRLRFSSERL